MTALFADTTDRDKAQLQDVLEVDHAHHVSALQRGGFTFGYILRGLLSLRDVEEIDRLEASVAQLEAGMAQLGADMSKLDAARWAKRQGLIR